MAWHEELPDRVMARLREIEPEPGALGREESVGDLGKDPAPVAERGIGPDRAAMVEIGQDLQAFFENVMRLAVPHVGYEADAAGVMLILRIVKTLRSGSERIGSRKDARRLASEALVELGLSVHLSAPRTVAILIATDISEFCRRVEDKTAASRAANRALCVEFFSICFRCSIRRRHSHSHRAGLTSEASFAQMVSKTVLSRKHARNEPATQAGALRFFDPAKSGPARNCQSIAAWGILAPQSA